MRYALISDLHANREAWRAVDADIRNHGADVVICLGDFIGYGPDPVAVLDHARERCAGAVIGDHDAIAAGILERDVFDDASRRLIDWTCEQIDSDAVGYFRSLPYKMGDDSMLCVHSDAVHPDVFGFIFDERAAKASFDAARQPVIFVGHTHVAGVFVQSPTGEVKGRRPDGFTLLPEHRYIIGTGSVGDPLDNSPRASYCLYDTQTREVIFRRVPFDFNGYRASIARRGNMITPRCLAILDQDQAESAVKGGFSMRPQKHDGQTGILKRQPRPTGPAALPASAAPAEKAEKAEAGAGIPARTVSLPAPEPAGPQGKGGRPARPQRPARLPESPLPAPAAPSAPPPVASRSKLPWILVGALALCLLAAAVVIIKLLK